MSALRDAVMDALAHAGAPQEMKLAVDQVFAKHEVVDEGEDPEDDEPKRASKKKKHK